MSHGGTRAFSSLNPIEFRVAEVIDLAHAALADRRGDVVDAEAGAGSQSQVVDYMGRTAMQDGCSLYCGTALGQRRGADSAPDGSLKGFTGMRS